MYDKSSSSVSMLSAYDDAILEDTELLIEVIAVFIEDAVKDLSRLIKVDDSPQHCCPEKETSSSSGMIAWFRTSLYISQRAEEKESFSESSSMVHSLSSLSWLALFDIILLQLPLALL
mmetsp:Transcript_23931/g.28238  ORF Transcript_23931/g.28238 Transcript_23931/m.28238 type:complete len:118 (-) Transcript_23931:36-389(-)